MDITAVNAYRSTLNLPPISGTGAAARPAGADEASGSDFGRVLRDAMKQLQADQAGAEAAMMQLASGQPVELHEVMLAMEKAQMGMQLAMQVRNKVIEAYQEVMRTPV